jgi:ABC-type sulfate/molybdate transport systems ATPase subunit
MLNVQEEYDRLTTERELLQERLKKKRRRNNRLARDIKAHVEAQSLLVKASEVIHKETVAKIENLITLCIRAVYRRPFQFRLAFKKGSKTAEAQPLIIEGDYEYHPKESKGGGMIELISFAFRVVLWWVTDPKTRNLFILDEPFKKAGIYIREIGEMLKYLSKKLRLQMVLLTHEDELIEICDRVYRVNHDGIKSRVKLVKGIKRR